MKELINIHETVKLPSTALQYMVDGLLRQSKRDDFIIDMATFGKIDTLLFNEVAEDKAFYVGKKYCFGCAATCTLQEIANKNIIPNDIAIARNFNRSKYLGFNVEEMLTFESAIDEFRIDGSLEGLFGFFYTGPEGSFQLVSLDWLEEIPQVSLTDNTWEAQLLEVYKIIDILKSKGF